MIEIECTETSEIYFSSSRHRNGQQLSSRDMKAPGSISQLVVRHSSRLRAPGGPALQQVFRGIAKRIPSDGPRKSRVTPRSQHGRAFPSAGITSMHERMDAYMNGLDERVDGCVTIWMNDVMDDNRCSMGQQVHANCLNKSRVNPGPSMGAL
jgi:hypothetical protein